MIEDYMASDSFLSELYSSTLFISNEKFPADNVIEDHTINEKLQKVRFYSSILLVSKQIYAISNVMKAQMGNEQI